MKKYLFIVFTIFFYASTSLVARDLNNKEVLYYGISPAYTSLAGKIDLDSINNLIVKSLNKRFNRKMKINDISHNYRVARPRFSMYRYKSHERWVIKGTFYYRYSKNYGDEFRFYINLLDIVSRRSTQINFTVSSERELLKRIPQSLNKIYATIAWKNNFFIKTKGVSMKKDSIIVMNIFNKARKWNKFKGLEKQIERKISRDTQRRLKVFKRRKNPFVHMGTKYYKNKKRFNDLSRLTGTRWILLSHIYDDSISGGYRLLVTLFDAHKKRSNILFQVVDKSPQRLKKYYLNNLESLYHLISSKEGYFLHRTKKLINATEYHYFGVTPYDNMNYIYGIHYYNNYLYLASSANVAKVNIKNGKIIQNYGSFGKGRSQYSSAMKVSVDGKKNVYILDSLKKKILVFKDNGTFTREFYYDQSYAYDFAVADNGNSFIPDITNSCINIYSKNGRFLKKITYAHGLLKSVVSSRGKIVVLLSNYSTLQFKFYDNKGADISATPKMINPHGVNLMYFALDEKNNIYGLDLSKNAVVKMSLDKKLVWVFDRFYGNVAKKMANPGDITVSPDGKRIFIADSLNKRAITLIETNFNVSQRMSISSLLKKAQRTKNNELKIAYINRALNQNPEHIRALILKADYYKKRENYDYAINTYQYILNRGKNRVVSSKLKKSRMLKIYTLARYYNAKYKITLKRVGPETARKYYNKAIEFYEEVLKLNKNNENFKREYYALKKVYKRSSGEVEYREPDIKSMKLKVVFSALYKYYSDNPLGAIVIKNTTGATIDRVYGEISIKNYMDYPTETRAFRGVNHGDTIKLKLHAVFNNKVLSVSEDTPLNIKFTLYYTIKGKKYSLEKKMSTTLYNRNAMTWDNTSKLSAFITAKDSSVKVFARSVVQMFRNSRLRFLNKELQYAIQIFDSLGTYGMTYVKDPKTPFSKYSKMKSQVDFIQYPRETLRFKTGDCDDLTVLYAAILENLGIETALVTVPGHILMMFNTGVDASMKKSVFNNTSDLIIHRGTVWIPVETTLMGKNFMQAWQSAVRQMKSSFANNTLAIIDSHKAWKEFAPVTLKDSTWEPKIPTLDMVHKIYYRDINLLINKQLRASVIRVKRRIKKNPRNYKLYNKLGVIYARFGKYKKASFYFKKALTIKKNYFSPYNNLGNIYMIQKRYRIALQYLKKAQKIRPGSSRLHINLALVYRKLNKRNMVRHHYKIAVKMNGSLKKPFGFLVNNGEMRASNADEDIKSLWIEK